ncbi:MAG TPA: lysophospholipid acyltransferase family protein [Candidatus Hydrogenedentes bacterium]|nr:lysophospholipid acyltransferase family protein [Candidatus Hydrogenedentota bacterium]
MKLPELDYSSPTPFTLKQRIALSIIPPVLYGAFSLLFSSCRWHIAGRETVDRVIAEDGGCIVPFWHESMAFAAWIHRGCGGHTLTSYSFDGELAARIVSWFGMAAVRGSSSRGGGEGLRQLVRACELGVAFAGFTLDGPRGPRRVAKPGVAVLAARTGRRIIPLAFSAVPCRRLRSWDRFPVPYPFARIYARYGDPLDPPRNEHPDEIERVRLATEHALNRLHDQTDREADQARNAADD